MASPSPARCDDRRSSRTPSAPSLILGVAPSGARGETVEGEELARELEDEAAAGRLRQAARGDRVAQRRPEAHARAGGARLEAPGPRPEERERPLGLYGEPVGEERGALPPEELAVLGEVLSEAVFAAPEARDGPAFGEKGRLRRGVRQEREEPRGLFRARVVDRERRTFGRRVRRRTFGDRRSEEGLEAVGVGRGERDAEAAPGVGDLEDAVPPAEEPVIEKAEEAVAFARCGPASGGVLDGAELSLLAARFEEEGRPPRLAPDRDRPVARRLPFRWRVEAEGRSRRRPPASRSRRGRAGGNGRGP